MTLLQALGDLAAPNLPARVSDPSFLLAFNFPAPNQPGSTIRFLPGTPQLMSNNATKDSGEGMKGQRNRTTNTKST